ncbi:variable surface lipoprotein [Mycoplasmopsis agalactiae]|uniref:variable surface lipoprotein n=1 Tax=Mycoplasmopsis agalactiae TaxID=2110 RepID=UPI00296257B1|nr:variable surface lipoprotein [Mycoplasmopsis agalactiae]
MKKSKFLLLGSLSSLAAIPFVAAKCDDTKDESKKPAETPGKDQKDPKAPADDKMPADKDKDQKDKEDKTGGNTSTDKKILRNLEATDQQLHQLMTQMLHLLLPGRKTKNSMN